MSTAIESPDLEANAQQRANPAAASMATTEKSTAPHNEQSGGTATQGGAVARPGAAVGNAGAGGLHTAGGPGAGRGPPNFKRLFIKKITISMIMITTVFWINIVYLFGSYYNESKYMHQIKMLAVDFDHSSVGAAMLSAIETTGEIDSTPTFEIVSSEDITPAEIRERVFKGDYWGAIYAAANSTTNYEEHLAGNNMYYNVSDAYQLFGNSARYTAMYLPIVIETLTGLAKDAESIFRSNNSLPTLNYLITNGNGTTPTMAQLGAILYPVGYTYHDVSFGSFQFGSRIPFNSLMIVVSVLGQFFFLMSLNGLSLAFGRFKNVSTRDFFKWRIPISIGWSTFMGLCLTSWEMLYKEGYPVTAGMFFGLWFLFTVFSIIVFDVLDIVTAFVPQPFIPFCMFTWLITNVTSAGSPIDLSNSFYKISWVFPAHAMWLAEMHIWSRGGAYPLSYSLPILAAWFVCAKIGTIFTVDARRKSAANAGPGGRPGGGPPGGKPGGGPPGGSGKPAGKP